MFWVEGEKTMYREHDHSVIESQQINIRQMLEHYRFTDQDAQKLHSLQSDMQTLLPKLLPEFYHFIFSFEHAKIFLHNKEILQKHEQGIQIWFMTLFCGQYDEAYFQQLNRISETHVRIGLPSHYVNTAFSFIREFLEKSLISLGKKEKLSAMHKIIDINLDILSLTYQEQEQQHFLNEVLLLKQSAQDQNIEPYVQPIIETEEGSIVKFECLMRLINPETQKAYSIYPLLSTAKSIKVYDTLMRLMVERSLSIFKTLPWTFSINLGYEDIANSDFRNFLYTSIRMFPDPERIIFEILESDFIEDFTVVYNFVNTIRELGCKIAIDDFGSGYSNIENIFKLKPEYLKIDASLIRQIDTSQTAFTVVRNVTNMAKELQIKTIAEHVHNEKILNIVQSLQIDYAQGFYIGKPFPGKELLHAKVPSDYLKK